ncbi:hypothetical protein GOP47_0016298 [Adiantum capillus-veneris]|uniref:3-hydroxybutyryl-CoA dehydrogenase n=1 Tax=Adiantum capillus-veneris TaxID=13818 RepID=A0A9D4UIB7_ADICA|nr:hypothetical protein GOP47_0016298 [Adiantum capillus-veneris]
MAQHVKVMGVVGAGQMGSGIAQLAAAAQLQVFMVDVNETALTRGLNAVTSSFSRFVKKGSISQEQMDKSLALIKTTTSLEHLEPVDFVVEAVAEDESLKRRIFAQLDKIVKPSAVLASNTSSISITRLANSTGRPNQVIGMHFMNPPPIMKLVEVVRGMATEDSVFETTKALAERFGKTVSCSKDYPGFIVNRILMPMINEAFYAVMEGVGTADDIDNGMKLGTNHPMGPLALADFIGLDTCLSIMRVLYQGLGDTKYRPCPLLVQYVDAGWLGKKTGRGVYQHP